MREDRGGGTLRARAARVSLIQKTASTRERRRPGRGGMSPKQKRALKALESGNALHERNGLSSHGLHRSTFGDGELNCRVRHGTG